MHFPSCVSITRPKQIKNLMFMYDAVRQGVLGGRVQREGGIATPLPFVVFFGYFLDEARK